MKKEVVLIGLVIASLVVTALFSFLALIAVAYFIQMEYTNAAMLIWVVVAHLGWVIIFFITFLTIYENRQADKKEGGCRGVHGEQN